MGKRPLLPGKLLFIAGLILLFCGTALLVPRMPAASTTQIQDVPKDMQDRMVREANKKRQQEIRDDTDKLFQLATDLKAAVDKSNENLLSLDVVRKADEVEKLAKKVKEKMKEAVGPPTPMPTPSPMPRNPLGFPH